MDDTGGMRLRTRQLEIKQPSTDVPSATWIRTGLLFRIELVFGTKTKTLLLEN